MTFKNAYEISLSSLTAAAYQSATASLYFNFGQRDKNFVAYQRVGTLSGTGNIVTKIQHAVEDPQGGAVNVDWKDLATFTTITATSSVQTIFQSTSLTSPLPFGRITQRVEAAGAGTTDFKNTLVRLLTETN